MLTWLAINFLKMKKTLLAMLALAGLSQAAHAQLALENFNGPGLPAGWTMFKEDNNIVTPTLYQAPIPTVLTAQAWMKRHRAAGDSAMSTVSNFTPPGRADRWLVTPTFTVNNPNMVIKWEDWASGGAQFNDSVQLWVSTTGGTTAASFTTKIYDAPVSPSATPYGVHAASLSAFNGQSIRVAFRNNTYQQGAIRIDNVETAVLPSNDMQMLSVTPDPSSPLAYGMIGKNFTISGTVKNVGISNVTSYTVKYQQGTNAPVSQTFNANIPAYGTANFTFTTPYSLTAIGDFPIKVWVELTGDANHANDTVTTKVTGVSFMPQKRLVFEEATGTWCGWCPRGTVFMDSMYKVYPHHATLIAVHNGDPMVITNYDQMIGALPNFPGYPAVVVDRREVIDPSEMFLAYNAEKDYFGFADINFTKPVISGTNLSTTVTVKPAINLNGDYRLALVITEDHVTGTGSGYNQVNYYSSGSQNLPLVGAGKNWQALPNPVPASQMQYDFVARAIVPNPFGAPGSLPSSMTAGTDYTYTFTTTLDGSWNANRIRVAVLLLRASDNTVLNSKSTSWPTSVNQLASDVHNAQLVPNPAKENARLTFKLDNSTTVTVKVVDGLGKSAYSYAQHMNSGDQSVNIPVANLAAGIYNVILTTDNGSIAERLNVIK